MVQEVQTSVSIPQENTLETIQAIGTSSVKIIEGRQTRGGHYISTASVSGSGSWDYNNGDERQSDKIQANMSSGSSSGKVVYTVRGKSVRIPIAGTYKLTLYWRGGSSTSIASIFMIKGISANDKELYTKTFNAYNSETVEFTLNFGKFDEITIWMSFYYAGSSSSATMTSYYTLSLSQI